MTNTLAFAGALMTLLSASACGDADLGTCDEAAAKSIVFAVGSNQPFYEGQAMISSSCGQGVCHSADTASPVSRFGAPATVDFDVTPIESCPRNGEPSVIRDGGLERLRAAITTIDDFNGSIIGEIEAGTMPPGVVGANYLNGPSNYTRADGSSLPAINTPEGLSILKNWMACGTPVIERTTGVGEIGDTATCANSPQ